MVEKLPIPKRFPSGTLVTSVYRKIKIKKFQIKKQILTIPQISHLENNSYILLGKNSEVTFMYYLEEVPLDFWFLKKIQT